MEHWLTEIARHVALVIDAMALLIIAASSLAAFVSGIRLMLAGSATSHQERATWLQHARWLVAGLTFQLAADLVRSAIAPTWDEIGRLAAIALIRTFLNYFLERDVVEVAERQRRDPADRETPGGRA